MGADLLMSMIAVPAHVADAPDVAAGHRALDALTYTRDFHFESSDEVWWFLGSDDGETDLYDAHGALRLDLAQSAGHVILDQFEEALGGRDVGQFLVGGYVLYVTGGMSWGDDPTEAFASFDNLHRLPAAVLAAMNVVVNPAEPPARRTGVTGSQAAVPPTDTDIVDALALGLGTQSEWDSSGLEWIADTIGYARLHPGNNAGPAAYLRQFALSAACDPTRDPFLQRYVDEKALTADPSAAVEADADPDTDSTSGGVL